MKQWFWGTGNKARRAGGRAMAVVFAAMLLGGIFPGEALADTKPIDSVKVRIDSKLKPGQKLPDEIGIGKKADDGGVCVEASNKRYHATEAEWVDKKKEELKAADEPKLKVTLTPEDVSEYYFLASYKKSNVSVSGGTFVSARRDGDNLIVTLRVKGVKGDYDSPRDAWWHEDNLGEARWEAAENDSGHYEVQLFRNGKSVHKISETTRKNYNFYPYMTEEGDYTFKVRTIPGDETQNKYGKKSEWAESGELQITERFVSDGKGKGKQDNALKEGTKDQVGWVKEGERWLYRYPDGNVCRGGWQMLDGYWYYFGMDGLMQTGWLNLDGFRYYLQPNGQMAVGWASVGGKWYYMRPETSGDGPAGSMVGPGWRVVGPYYFFFNEDGSMYTGWLSQDGKSYYLNELDNGLQGAMFVGWIQRDGKTWYAGPNGDMVEGWWEIDGKWYYFYPGSYEMARNTSINGFYVNEDGIWWP